MADIKLTKIKEYLDKVKDLSDPASSERLKALSEWKRKGEYPFQQVGIQFEILEYYFNVANEKCSVADDPLFLNLLYKLVNALGTLPCQSTDARFFYSQTLSVGTKQVCMYDLLKRILEVKLCSIRTEMELFALFLLKNNPSYIVQSEGLKGLYTVTCVGPGFSLPQFSETTLPLLFRKASPAILGKLNAFALWIKNKSTLSTEDADELKNIFALRWSEVAGERRDYTRNQQGVNADWIMVAQLLSGAGIFPVDYYNILMPTLQHTHDLWTKDRLTHYPLSHYVLSSDKKKLILLDTCAHHYRSQKIEPRRFYNCSVHPQVEFDSIERSRIVFAAPRFRHFENVFNNENHNKEELPLKRSTVLRIAELVKASLENGRTTDDLGAIYAIFDEALDSLPGDSRARVLTSAPLEEDIIKVLSSREILIIRSGDSYEIGFCNDLGDYQQENINDLAIREFLRPYEEGDFVTCRRYKDELNKILTSFGCRTRIDEERLRFLYHRIKFGTFDLNPKYILGQIALGLDPEMSVDAGCVREYCNNFMQLVIDYSREPSDFDFPLAIEKIISSRSMRENATKMIFSDALCSHGEIIDRNLILMWSLLTYSFPNSSEGGYVMSFMDYENTTIDPVVPIIFEQLVKELENVFANRSYKPVDVVDEFVLPLILRKKVDTLSPETQNWLKLIRTKNFFSNQCNFYDPKHLFLALSSLDTYTHVFLDEILQIMQKPGVALLHMLHINIKFSSFLSILSKSQQGHVLKSLAETRREVTYGAFFRSVYHFIVSRMPSVNSEKWLSNVFGRKQESTLTENFKCTGEKKDWDNFSSLDEVLMLIQDVLNNTPDVPLPVKHYFASKASTTPASSFCGGTRHSSRTNSSSRSSTPRSAAPSPQFTYEAMPVGSLPPVMLGK